MKNCEHREAIPIDYSLFVEIVILPGKGNDSGG